MTRLRMGLVGGGEGAFIGAVHRIAAELDGRIELVCGAFSSNPSRSKRFGQELYDLPPNRSYGTFNEMVTEELRLPAEERMHFVVIATPNHLHFPVAESALQAGFHVVSDKPVTFDLGEARTLRALALGSTPTQEQPNRQSRKPRKRISSLGLPTITRDIPWSRKPAN